MAVHVDIVGSCVTRDAFTFSPRPDFYVHNYVARQTFVGFDDPGVWVDPTWYAALPAWEQKCVMLALGKGDGIVSFSAKAQYLLIDFVDERFDLIQVGASRVPAIRQVQQAGFIDHYRDQVTPLARLDPAVFEAWKAGAKLFLDSASKRFRPEQIVLHKAFWAPDMCDASGATIEYDAKTKQNISKNNEMLVAYYDAFEALQPGCRTIEIDSHHVHADPEHKWSKEPFHYVNAYYASFMEQLARLTQ